MGVLICCVNQNLVPQTSARTARFVGADYDGDVEIK